MPDDFRDPITLEGVTEVLRERGLKFSTRTTTTVSVLGEADDCLVHIMEFGQDGRPDVFREDGPKAGGVTVHWQGPALGSELDMLEPTTMVEFEISLAALLNREQDT